MENSGYLIQKNIDGGEDLFIIDNVLFDIIQGKIVLYVKHMIVWEYWRRTMKYSIGSKNFCISINPNLQPFQNMGTSDEKIQFVEKNWKDFARLSFNRIYPNDITINFATNYIYNNEYQFLIPDGTETAIMESAFVYSYFKQNYKDLNHIAVYNGYITNEKIGNYEIPK